MKNKDINYFWKDKTMSYLLGHTDESPLEAIHKNLPKVKQPYMSDQLNGANIKHDGTKATTLALIERRRVLEARAQRYGFKTWWDAQDAYQNHDCDTPQGQGCEVCAMWHEVVGIE